MYRNWFFVTLFVVFYLLPGCSPKSPDEFDNEKALYDYGLSLYEQKRYAESADFFEALKNRYPTSPYITDAEFKLGESYYKRKDYIEAIFAFQNFKYLHPTNPNVPFATYRIAMSYYKQVPGSIDRDQTNTVNSITSFNELISRYPNFEEIDKAKKTLAKCKRMLAERELYVANFYLKQKSYKAALGRLETVKTEYNFKDLKQEAIYKLAYSYHKLNDRDKTVENINTLLSMNPDQKYREKADKLIAKLKKEKNN